MFVAADMTPFHATPTATVTCAACNHRFTVEPAHEPADRSVGIGESFWLEDCDGAELDGHTVICPCGATMDGDAIAEAIAEASDEARAEYFAEERC